MNAAGAGQTLMFVGLLLLVQTTTSSHPGTYPPAAGALLVTAGSATRRTASRCVVVGEFAPEGSDLPQNRTKSIYFPCGAEESLLDGGGVSGVGI
jgi:hypothetical protein